MATSPDRSPVDDSIDPDKEARMLLNPPQTDQVQFTSNSNNRDPTNGQVLLSPVGTGSSPVRSGVGMTKQELMKYANDPTWIRLRTFFFILFWVIWFAMLIGSIVIVAMAPGCPSTASLPWWKKSSIMDIFMGDITTKNRASYASQLTEKLEKVQSELPKLSALSINTITVGPFDPYILIPSENENNSTKEKIDQVRDQIAKLARNEKEIKVIANLQLQQTPETFEWFNKSRNNETEFVNAYIWSKEKPESIRYKFDVDRLEYVALGTDNNSTLLNYAEPKVRDLIRDAILAWMKLKVEGIQVGALWSQNPTDQSISKSKEAELDLLKTVKSAGQNKVLLMTDQQLSEDAFEEGEEAASFDMAPDDLKFWNKLVENFKFKDSFEKVFAPYVKQEQQHMKDQNKTEDDILVNRDNVGKHWRTYEMRHPSDHNNRILSENDLGIAEATAVAINMIPRVTPILKFDLGANLDELKQKSNVVERMLSLRQKNPETFLAGRTILPKVNSNDVFALYRAAKKEDGYLLLVNQGSSEQTVKIDSGELPYQDDIVSKRVIWTNSEAPKDMLGIDVDMDSIKLAPKQSMLIEFSAK